MTLGLCDDVTKTPMSTRKPSTQDYQGFCDTQTHACPVHLSAIYELLSSFNTDIIKVLGYGKCHPVH